MDTKLHTAVRYGNVNAVLEALKDGLNPNEMGLFKWSSVHEAANNGERDILKLLLSYKGEVNLRDNLHGNTPLHYATREDNSACVTVLLKAGARIDINNYEGMNCLDEATPLCREIIQEFAIGQLHLSFEYRKMTLKIRVWQVDDLLLPPPQISMIDSMFVRSYLIPDTAKKTYRQTEAVRVEPQSKDSTLAPQNGIQHIFSPSSFRFETPLLYTGITQDIIAERSVQLEVCMTQKFTHKAFLMAMVHLPLRAAVRHPIREKYPLIPCMNYTIPNNMRVYSAREFIIEKSQFLLDRPPSRSNSVQSSFSCPPTSRDTYLEDVEVENLMRRASLELSDSDCDDDLGSSSYRRSSLGKSGASSAVTVDVMSLSTDNEDITGSFRDAVGLQNKVSHSIAVDTDSWESQKPKKKIIPNELLDKSSGSEKDLMKIYKDESEDSTVIKKEVLNNRTLVKISALQSNEALDWTSNDNTAKINNQIILKDLPNGRKKIIPPELLNTSEMMPKESQKQSVSQNSDKVCIAHESIDDHNCFYDDIQSDYKNSSHNNASESAHPDLEDTCRVEETGNSEHNHLEQNQQNEDQEYNMTSKVSHASLESCDTEPSSSTVSRPETPIWDFYDFTLEESAESGAEAETGSLADEASTALGTLQESISRLTRASKALDTCRVTGPVLPTVMIEDFEMDGDDADEDNVDDKGES